MGEFICRIVDRASGRTLSRFRVPNLLAYEGYQSIYQLMFPTFISQFNFSCKISGATDQGRPNAGGGLTFDENLTLAQVGGWGTGSDGGNQGGGYTAAHATSFSTACASGLVPVFTASMKADGGFFESQEMEFANGHSWTPQAESAWDNPGTTPLVEQAPPEWYGKAPDDPEVKYPWHWPRKLCADVGTSLAYMKTWDGTGALDWLCDFRKISGFPITLAFFNRVQIGGGKLLGVAKFSGDVHLRPGQSLFVKYQGRIDGDNISRDFAIRYAKYAFEKTGSRYSAIYVRPLLFGAPTMARTRVYSDYSPHFHAHFTQVNLTSWTYNAGTPPYLTSNAPTWTNSSGSELGPFVGFAVYGDVGGTGTLELMFVTTIDQTLVPDGDVLRIPTGVRFLLRNI